MANTISQKDIEQAQQDWGKSVVLIGKAFLEKKDFKAMAEKHVEKFYGYVEGTVLFKPTKASETQFRLSAKSAISYFVGNNPAFPEDHGFALQPWTNVRFENTGFIFPGKYAVAMGNYFFSSLDGSETKVEYTFGYFLSEKGELKINLHHSSLPYQ